MRFEKRKLIELYTHQVYSLYGCRADISAVMDETIACVNTALSASASKYCAAEVAFSPFHTGQYCLFLYYLSKQLVQKHRMEEADLAYCLNKALHAVDIYHGVDLPTHFYVEHPLGSVMGRAVYGDYFFFYQGCTVGGSNGKYPVIGEHVTMLSDAKILGDSYIGDYVILSANTYVCNETIPSDCLVFGQSPNLIVKRRSHEEMLERFREYWLNNSK